MCILIRMTQQLLLEKQYSDNQDKNKINPIYLWFDYTIWIYLTQVLSLIPVVLLKLTSYIAIYGRSYSDKQVRKIHHRFICRSLWVCSCLSEFINSPYKFVLLKKYVKFFIDSFAAHYIFGAVCLILCKFHTNLYL